MQMKYTVVDSRGSRIIIEADYFIWSEEYNCLGFTKCNKCVAIFNTNNIIGLYERDE